MKQIASAQITGFVESSSAEQGEVGVAGIKFKIDNADNLEIGDLITLNASLDERGDWHGAITMHLGRPACSVAEIPAGTTQQQSNHRAMQQPAPALQSVQAPIKATHVAAAPTPSERLSSRAQRFAQAQGQLSPRRSLAPSVVSPTTSATKARPAFNIDDDMDLDIPF